LTIDLQKPSLSVLKGTYYNISSNAYGLIDSLSSGTWAYANKVNFSWQGFDFTSGVSAYSYILTMNPAAVVDEVPEGDINNLAGETAKVFTNLKSGTYYFYLKVKDIAGNWGDVSSLNISIDNTAPSKPEILTEERENNNLIYTWSESSDPESNIEKYMINLSYPDGSYYKSNTTDSLTQTMTFVNIGTGTYNVTVGAMNGVGIWRWSNEVDITADSTPPEIRATPNRTVITNTPIIKAWTNEQAVCIYNISTTEYEFAYTNTTYHEAKTGYLANGQHYVTITCEDMSGNADDQDINFTINTELTPDTVDGASEINTYESLLTTIPVIIKDGSNTTLLPGGTPERFSMSLEGKDTEISVFDKGDGTYNLTFYAPEESGSYSLVLKVGGTALYSATLNVNLLYLSSTYSKPGISSTNTSHITYYAGGGNTYGLATDEDRQDLVIASGQNNLSLTNIKQDENLFIFSTKPGLAIASREDLLNSRNFMKRVIPSFGYQLDDTYIIHFILRYDNFAIQSELGDELEKGYYVTRIKYLFEDRIGDKKRIIKFVNAQEQQNKIILTSG
jgi:hypothetical protein